MILNPNDWSRKSQKALFWSAWALAVVCMMGAGALLWSQDKAWVPLGVVSVICAGAALYLAYDLWWKKHATGEDACKNKDGETCSSDPKSDKGECGSCLNKPPAAATDKEKSKNTKGGGNKGQ